MWHLFDYIRSANFSKSHMHSHFYANFNNNVLILRKSSHVRAYPNMPHSSWCFQVASLNKSSALWSRQLNEGEKIDHQIHEPSISSN